MKDFMPLASIVIAIGGIVSLALKKRIVSHPVQVAMNCADLYSSIEDVWIKRLETRAINLVLERTNARR